MFTENLIKSTQEYFSTFPKTPEELKAIADKAKNVYIAETKKVSEVLNIYQKASTGDATINEISTANRKTKEIFTTARFATVMSIPGAIFVYPLIKKVADELNIDFVPESVKQEFNI